MTATINPTDTGDRLFLGVGRSACGRAWRHRLDPDLESVATAIGQRLGQPDLIGRVLAGRGVDVDDAERHLSPSLRDDMPDPSVLTDLDAAADRLAFAVGQGERVAIFGDYDVDGAASAALFAIALEQLGCPTEVHIPDRIIEGYGPNGPAIDRLIDGGAGLIVTVDCGTASHAALDVAGSRGTDVIVVDHHQTGVDLPPARALVNPNRQDDVSGLGYLAAAGVAFLVLAGLLRVLRTKTGGGAAAPDLLEMLDLVALGTVCDVVPLVGLNRALVSKGLIAMRHRPRPGIRALAAVSRLKGPLDTGQLGFAFGPRINAGGRIGEASLGVRLLTTSDADEAGRIADTLERLNRERQAIEIAAVDDAAAEADAECGSGGGPPVLVLARKGWHPGIVGLIASRIKDRFHRPVFAVSLDGETGTGSGRSVNGVDIGAAVRAAVDAGVLVKGGGHAMAAGLTVTRDRIGDLRSFLESRLGGEVEKAAAGRALLIDGALTANGASLELIEALARAGPFGTGNPQPVFAFPAHRITYADTVGANHVRAGLSSGAGGSLKGIAFRVAGTPLGDLLLQGRGKAFHVAGTIDVDHWGGSPRPQLRIVDAAAVDGRY